MVDDTLGLPYPRPAARVANPALTEQEQTALYHLVQAWNAFVDLPIQHGDDITEFRHGIHRLQEKILARPARKMDGAGRFA